MFNKTLSCMTDIELANEHELCNSEIHSRDRWGDDLSETYDYRAAVEAEQRGRRLSRKMAERIAIQPIVLDAPPPRSVAQPLITGTAMARCQRRPSAAFLLVAVGALICCLGVSMAFAGQRLVEIDARYAAQDRV